MTSARTILLGLGSNLAGPWGSPRATLARALNELTAAGLRILGFSSLYTTTPVGLGRQPAYLNAVVLVDASMALAALLRTLKHIERRAGRRLGRHWGPRQLDIDILDAKAGVRATALARGCALLAPSPPWTDRISPAGPAWTA